MATSSVIINIRQTLTNGKATFDLFTASFPVVLKYLEWDLCDFHLITAEGTANIGWVIVLNEEGTTNTLNITSGEELSLPTSHVLAFGERNSSFETGSAQTITWWNNERAFDVALKVGDKLQWLGISSSANSDRLTGAIRMDFVS